MLNPKQDEWMNWVTLENGWWGVYVDPQNVIVGRGIFHSTSNSPIFRSDRLIFFNLQGEKRTRNIEQSYVKFKMLLDIG